MQQHGQHQHLDIGDAVDDGGRGRVVGLQLAARDVVDDADGLKRMLVDRIGVIHVELGLAGDPPPFGQEPPQQTRLVHDRQDAIGPLAMRQHRQEGLGRARVAPQGRRHQRQGADHGGEGVGVQVQIQPVRLDEQQQQPHRVMGEDASPRHCQPPALDGQTVEGQFGAPPWDQPRQPARQTLRLLLLARLQLGRDGAGQGADLARHLEIAAHEALDRQFVAAPAPAHAPGDLGLVVEGQLLFRPPRRQMQVDAHAPQKADGLAEAAQLARAQQALQRRLPAFAVGRQGPGDPEQGVQVAKPALAVLDIGFDAIAHRPGFLQTDVPLLHLGGDEGARIGLGDLGAKPLQQALAQIGVAGQHPRLQQRRAHRHVVARQRQGLADRARGRADLRA
ncbi:hypothetical protein D3C72_1221720 [compost metagenome]